MAATWAQTEALNDHTLFDIAATTVGHFDGDANLGALSKCRKVHLSCDSSKGHKKMKVEVHVKVLSFGERGHQCLSMNMGFFLMSHGARSTLGPPQRLDTQVKTR